MTRNPKTIVDATPEDLSEIREWAAYAKREGKTMGIEPAAAIALLDRLQRAERDRDHYYLAAEIEAREVDRQKAAAKAAAGKLSDALSRCLKAMHHAAPFFQRGVEATLLTDAITAAQEAIVEGIDLGCVQEPAQALSNEEIDLIANTMPGGLDGFLKGWGWRNFARAVEGEVLSRQEGRGGAPVAWIQAEPSARGADLRTVMQGVAYSTQWHWQSERPATTNPVWPVFAAAPTPQSDYGLAEQGGLCKEYPCAVNNLALAETGGIANPATPPAGEAGQARDQLIGELVGGNAAFNLGYAKGLEDSHYRKDAKRYRFQRANAVESAGVTADQWDALVDAAMARSNGGSHENVS